MNAAAPRPSRARPSRARAPQQSEEFIQQAVIRWFERNYPEDAIALHHSPNGGARSLKTGVKMKLAGTRRGFPDLLFPQRRGEFAGLALELKAEGGRISPEQLGWLDFFAREGWHACVAVGRDAALDTLKAYMALARRF